MRLLHTETLQLSEFWGLAIPSYAILSHTWEEEEVTFQDVMSGGGTSKKGYLKILSCCQVAREDGFEYVWIDTCCIDKFSSAELSEAINSMFKWYRKSETCYAYLSDWVWLGPDQTTLDNLHACRWFTRGWTLQELLAPGEVIFFSRDWNRIGDRQQWASDISFVTSIHKEALSGNVDSFLAFSVAQKFSWASTRNTTREEDIAYCLLGLFGVHMPLLYGEGQQAFIRLEEEIIKKSDDQSIFAWSPTPFEHYDRGMLVTSPAYFRWSSEIAPFRNWRHSEPYEMTNAGLRMHASLARVRSEVRLVLILQCYNTHVPERLLGAPLLKLTKDGDQYARGDGRLRLLEGNDCTFLPSRTIYIRNDTIRPGAHEMEATGKHIMFRISACDDSLPFTVKDSWPRSQWDPGRSMILPPTWSRSNNPRDYLEAPELALTNWSWHVALLIGVAIMKDFATVEMEEIMLAIGYNGRDDTCWVSKRREVNLGLAWENASCTNVSAREFDWMIEDHRNLSASIAVMSPDGGLLPSSITESWTGQPMQVRMTFKSRVVA